MDASSASPINEGLRGDFGGAPLVLNAELMNLPAAVTAASIPAVNTLGFEGGIGICDTNTLQPGTRAPYWIDEIRITGISGLGTFDSGDDPYDNGFMGCLGVKFQTGKYNLMKDFVPAALLAPSFGLDSFNEVIALEPQRPTGEVRWVLPKPLYLAAGDVLQCSVRNMQKTQPIYSVNITYMGRQASPGTRPPPVVHVPWVAGYRTDLGNGTEQRTSGQFRNPFSKTLWVQRYTYRSYFSSGAGLAKPMTGPAAYLTGQPYRNSPTIRMFDSLGYVIVPGFAPAYDVFDSSRGAWTFGRSLGPREEFNLQVNMAGDQANQFNLFGMVGFREEEV